MRKGIVSAIDKGTVVILVALTCVMVSITFAQVFARYVLTNPLHWSEELARYCFVWIVFIGAGAALKRGAHIAVDFFVMHLSKRSIRVLSIPVKALMAIFLVVVIVNAIPVIKKNMSQLSPAIGIPMGIVYLAIPIGAAIMLIYTLDDLIELIHPRPASGTTGGR